MTNEIKIEKSNHSQTTRYREGCKGESPENGKNNFKILLFTSIFEMEYTDSKLSSVINLNELRPFTIIFRARSKHD